MKKYLKKLVALGIVIGVSAGSCSSAFAMPGVIGQWEHVGNRWKYKLPDGSYYYKPKGSDAPNTPISLFYPIYPAGGVGFVGDGRPILTTKIRWMTPAGDVMEMVGGGITKMALTR